MQALAIFCTFMDNARNEPVKPVLKEGSEVEKGEDR